MEDENIVHFFFQDSMGGIVHKILVIERFSILLFHGKVITLNVVGDVFTLASACGLDNEGMRLMFRMCLFKSQ